MVLKAFGYAQKQDYFYNIKSNIMYILGNQPFNMCCHLFICIINISDLPLSVQCIHFQLYCFKLPVSSSNSDALCDKLSFLQTGQMMVHTELPTNPPQPTICGSILHFLLIPLQGRVALGWAISHKLFNCFAVNSFVPGMSTTRDLSKR